MIRRKGALIRGFERKCKYNSLKTHIHHCNSIRGMVATHESPESQGSGALPMWEVIKNEGM